MKARRLLIDGYSLVHRDPRLTSASSLMNIRRRLVQRLEGLLGEAADHITVVFDGRDHFTPDREDAASQVEIVFSPGHQTADTVIERMVQQSPRPDDILVVTSDRLERETVMAAGAHTMSCGEFLEWSENCERGMARRAAGARQSAPRATLGDFFPKP